MTAARELEALERKWRSNAENGSGTYHDGYNAALHACADELAAIRSQLGQGAVAWCQADDPLSSTAFSWPGSDRNPTHTTPLFPHPVQSVAVDEAMVRRALCAPYGDGDVSDMLLGGGDEEAAVMRAALAAALEAQKPEVKR